MCRVANKYNGPLERECQDMKVTINKLRMTVQKEYTSHHQSVLRPPRKPWDVVADTAEVEDTIK